MIKTTTNKEAFRKFALPEASSQSWLDGWLADNSQPTSDYRAFYWVCAETHKTGGFALLRRCEIDTFDQHTDPWIIMLIYTMPSYRRKRIALHLLEAVRRNGHQELTALCINTEGRALFDRASFTRLNIAPFKEGWELRNCPTSFDTFTKLTVMRFP
jgi:GNAT superfamily N-acetyltransferase